MKMEVVNNFVKTYRSLAQIPALVGAKIISCDSSSDSIKVLSRWSQRNIEKGEISKFKKHHILNVPTGDVLFESMPVDVSQEVLGKASRSEKLNCVVREVKEDNKKKQYLEIWSKEGLFKNFDISAFDLHGDIYCDGEFGSLDWSPNDDKIIYIAEKKIKSQAFYKQKSKEEKNQHEKFLEGDIVVGDEYLYKPDWGEQLVGKHHPVVVLCNLTTETLKVLDGIPLNFSPGQVVWSKDGKSIFGIALETEPRRLGLIYCTNRIGYIFQLTLEGEFKILSGADKSVSSPRISPDGASLFWLQRPAKGAHGGCYELVKYDLTSNKSEVLINIIQVGNKEFSGLYMHNLPVRCFSEDGKKLFFSTLNRNKIMSYALDIESKNLQVLETGDGSSTILDVHKNIIVISSGTLQKPSVLRISKSIEKIEWIPLTKSNIICENSVLKEFEFNSEDSTHSFRYYNAFYYGPSPSTTGEATPLIVYPHGGPHSATTNEFWLEPTFFVSLGYGVLMVNYRGSTGAGQDGIDFLMGKVGDTDVKDNHNAVLSLLKNVPYLDPKNIFLFGKSHGGFLVGHLSAQYPDFYRAVVNLNGVTDIFAMYTMSDIPDWSTAESGLVFDESKPLPLTGVNAMLSKSPIQLADKIKAPTLFMLGKNDLRVPHYQGIKLYNALKSRKVKVRLNLYEDNHSLASVPVHIDCTIHSALWFYENKI